MSVSVKMNDRGSATIAVSAIVTIVMVLLFGLVRCTAALAERHQNANAADAAALAAGHELLHHPDQACRRAADLVRLYKKQLIYCSTKDNKVTVKVENSNSQPNRLSVVQWVTPTAVTAQCVVDYGTL